eukprot:6191241-Pleurochrysis_carterae.AAC.3
MLSMDQGQIAHSKKLSSLAEPAPRRPARESFIDLCSGEAVGAADALERAEGRREEREARRQPVERLSKEGDVGVAESDGVGAAREECVGLSHILGRGGERRVKVRRQHALKVPAAHRVEPARRRLGRAAQNELDDRRYRRHAALGQRLPRAATDAWYAWVRVLAARVWTA